jgi:hypothetical protein
MFTVIEKKCNKSSILIFILNSICTSQEIVTSSKLCLQIAVIRKSSNQPITKQWSFCHIRQLRSVDWHKTWKIRLKKNKKRQKQKSYVKREYVFGKINDGPLSLSLSSNKAIVVFYLFSLSAKKASITVRISSSLSVNEFSGK